MSELDTLYSRFKAQLDTIASYEVPPRITSVDMAKKLKRDLTQNQKELRQLKTEINQTIKSIRSQVNETTANQQSGFIMKKLLGKGKARSLDADRKRAVKQKGSQIIEPFQKLVSIIDKYILTYDNVKNQMTNIIEEHK